MNAPAAKNQPPVMICGSMAYDSIMVFEGHFKEHILPDRIHALNVSFFVPAMRREFGGCAGNMAYNLHLLGGNPLPVATVGSDSQPYLDRFKLLGINTRGLKLIKESFTAQAFITTDLDDNQITAFHPGAMSMSDTNTDVDLTGVRVGIVGPDSKEGMRVQANRMVEHGIPFIFDIGQALPIFSGQDIIEMVNQADYMAANDYEASMIEERTGKKMEELAAGLKATFVTLGAQGSIIFADGKRHEIPLVPAEKLADPTGCGDAYRAGLLYGIVNGLDWPTAGRLASLLGSIKIAHQGPQNHYPSRQELSDRFHAAFGYRYE